MRVLVGHHHVRHPDETFQPNNAADGRRRISRLQQAHAGCTEAQDGGNTHVPRRLHDEGDRLVSYTGLVRDTGHGDGDAGSRQPHRRQVGFTKHADGGLVVPGRYKSGEYKIKKNGIVYIPRQYKCLLFRMNRDINKLVTSWYIGMNEKYLLI